MARQKYAFVDYWTLCQNYSRGDIVQTYNYLYGGLEGYPGMVTAVHPGIGFIDVEFPWGNERVSPEFLVKQNPRFLFNYPSFIDTSYNSWDIDQAHLEDGTDLPYNYAAPRNASVQDKATRLAAEYDVRQRKLRTAAAMCRYSGLNSVDAYRAMNDVLYGRYGDHEIRTAVDSTYKLGLYWKAPGRRYRMNKGEIDDGLPNCPKCDTNLQKTNYKKHTKLFVCPHCLFCIKPADIEGLPGQIADTGFGVTEEGEGDILEEALVTVAREKKIGLKWDTLKKQVRGYVRRKFKKQRKLAEQVAVVIVNEFADKMNVHEDRLPEKELAPLVKDEIVYLWEQELKDQVEEAAQKRGFDDIPEAVTLTMDYIQALDYDEILAVDEKEISRLLDVYQETENERIHRYATGLRAVLAVNSPTPKEVRERLGADGLQRIHAIVRNGSRSDAVTTQFEDDFRSYGLGDAMFLLGTSAADGLFDRTAYNELVDILESARSVGG